MKYCLLGILILLSSCCSPKSINIREEVKYTYKDSINYIVKADSIKVIDTIPFINFFPYVASTNKIQERIIYRSDGTFRKKYDSLQLEYSLLDSTFKVTINSSPDSVYREIKTVTIEKESYTKIIATLIIGIIVGVLGSLLKEKS